MNSQASAPPIVLVHGLWLTPRSWEGWKERFESRGPPVLAPAWPRKSKAVVDYKEFAVRPHFTAGAPGWEKVADHALDSANRHPGAPADGEAPATA